MAVQLLVAAAALALAAAAVFALRRLRSSSASRRPQPGLSGARPPGGGQRAERPAIVLEDGETMPVIRSYPRDQIPPAVAKLLSSPGPVLAEKPSAGALATDPALPASAAPHPVAEAQIEPTTVPGPVLAKPDASPSSTSSDAAPRLDLETIPCGTAGLMILRTRGLNERGLPELEIAGLREEDVPAATPILETAADYVQTEPPDGSRATFAWDLGPAMAAVRWQMTDDEVVRIHDVQTRHPGDEPPRIAMATVMYARAMRAVEDGDPEAAREELRRSVEFCPGNPAGRVSRFPRGQVFNNENHLAWLALAKLEPQHAPECYRHALERSRELEHFELGAATLPALDQDALRLETASLIAATLDDRAGGDSRRGVGPRFLLSPIWEAGPDGKSARALSLLPVEFASCFFEGTVAERLRADTDVHRLAADLYCALVDHPLDLLVATREVRELYLQPTSPGLYQDDEQRVAESPTRRAGAWDYKPHHKMLSSITADLGRKLSAGLTLPEIRASYGCGEEAARVTGETKMRRQRARELGWYQAAMRLSAG